MLGICRPVISLALIWKHGRESTVPLKVSLGLDLIIAVIGLWRLQGSQLKQFEKNEIKQRIQMAFLKYLIRQPVFETHTKVILTKLFKVLRISDKVLSLLLSVLNYFKYYAYIA